MAATLVMAQQIGRDVHPFFKPKQNLDLTSRPTSDLEEPLPKRQRTQSPDDRAARIPQWEEERLNETWEKPGSNNVVEERAGTEITLDQVKPQHDNHHSVQAGSTVDAVPIIHQASEISQDAENNGPVHHTPPKKMLKIRPNGKLASPQAKTEHHPDQDNVEMPPDVDQPPKRANIKRNFKISASGTLDSPDLQEASHSPKRRGRKKKSEAGAMVKPTCIVALKYRVADGPEASIGRQVEDILSGNKSRKAALQPDRPRDPPKSTHPFFTGELSRKSKVDLAPAVGDPARVIDLDGGQLQQPSKTSSGPRESRITSKPPGAPRHIDTVGDGSLPTFGTDHAKITRFPGAAEPVWPPFGMFHIRILPTDEKDHENAAEEGPTSNKGRKLKDAQIQISPEESVLNKTTKSVAIYDYNDTKVSGLVPRIERSFRRPRRKVMTGAQLQQAICSRVSCSISNSSANKELAEQLSSSPPSNIPTHKGLRHIIDQLPLCRSAFDDFRCENEEWIHKYSPKRTEHVLQSGREPEILRDWLKALTVSAVGSGGDECRTRDSSVSGRRGGMKVGRKKKRRTGEFDDFVVSDDDEHNELAEIADAQDQDLPNSQDKKSVMRAALARDGERTANAVIISGPHGCGKTAAVFAAAKELDFEIFEVNSGSRRSGKDVLDKVGDMTRNHLVQHRPDIIAAIDPIDHSLDLLQPDEKLQADLTSGRQGTMQSFFKVQSAKENNPPKAEAKKGRPKKKVLQEVLPKPRDQKQSLILLEEVDVLFEEDKLFWATVLDLLARSKRPVIMTCTDESLVPFDNMALHAIFRFTPPPISLATDYLMLVAASEGHLLSRDAVQSLYEVKGSDLRASLTELNFYCQMGIGDTKGGLEWMLLDKPDNLLENKESLRVISEDTYCSGMGWLGGEDSSSQVYRNHHEIIELSSRLWDGWQLDIGATDLLESTRRFQKGNDTTHTLLDDICKLDEYYEAFSAADVLPGSVARHDLSIKIDISQPYMTNKTRSSYIEGPTLLQSDPLIDHSGMSDSLALALRTSAAITSGDPGGFSISVRQVNETIALSQGHSRRSDLTLMKMASIFGPVADDPSSTYVTSKNMSTSSFDGPLSTILQDVAPYVRSIVSYDLRLEEQRRQLSSLLVQPGSGNKKSRTTRASRAALEGSSKANVRRERWFPKQTDFDAVLSTGGKGWQEVALATNMANFENQSVGSQGSRRSSIANRIVVDDME